MLIEIEIKALYNVYNHNELLKQLGLNVKAELSRKGFNSRSFGIEGKT